MFPRIYVNLCYTAIKDTFFFVCLFFLLTITGRDEAIIVELKSYLFWIALLSPVLGVPIIRFLAIMKNDASSRL